ncbi:MAG: hypothetical protein PVI30_27675 [Myxococcales bacterium]|jgi:hypothetical protein
MSSGFRYLLIALVTITALFAGISLWPALKAGWRGSPAQTTPAPAQPAPSAAPAPSGGSAANRVSRHAQRSLPTWTAAAKQEEPAARRNWLYAQVSVVLRTTPDGIGFRAPSLCQAPLTIVKGTRLWPVRTEGDWVMVRSPSGLLGYVHTSEIDSHLPYFKRKY